jgi:hypothetical protein
VPDAAIPAISAVKNPGLFLFGNFALRGKRRCAGNVNPSPGIQDGFPVSGVLGDGVRAVGMEFDAPWSA